MDGLVWFSKRISDPPQVSKLLTVREKGSVRSSVIQKRVGRSCV